MSLLLEALKKAELAKQNASGQQGEDTLAPADLGGGLSLEQTPAAGERPLITRDRLPDITQPLEILSEDLPSAGARREAPPASGAPGLAPMAAAPGAAAATEDDDRASARQLFEAKTPDYDPRRPFFILVGILGVGIVGALGYFAWEFLAPRPSFYTPPPGAAAPPPATTAAAPPQPPAATPAPSAPTPSDAAPAASAASAASTQAGPAAATAAAPPAPQPAPASGVTRTSRPATARPAPAPTGERAESGPEPAPAGPTVRITTGGPRVDPMVESGWEALQAGDLPRAREAYQRALRANPRDRDALLGLATIDARTQNFESAEVRYLRVLELDPRDPYAQAGLLALRGQTDPLQSESRIKNMLAQQPDAGFLNFPLGNQYAAQGRWSEAQAAYFKAFSADQDNPDYAYNLAISLDHLGQRKLALEYYRRALALAGNRAVGFNSAQVEARIRELTR